MDWLTFIRGILSPTPQPPAAGAPMEMNQRDLDLRDPATGQLMPGGVPAAPPPPVAAPSAQTGLGTRPLNAQEALQKGDPKLIEALRARQVGGAQPQPATTPKPAGGYGAVPARQTSFGDGTGSQ